MGVARVCRYAGKLRAAPEATSRADASMLSSALENALPEGALVAKYHAPARNATEATQAYSSLLHIRADFQLVDATLREATRLVAGQCVDRAAAIEKVLPRNKECQGARASCCSCCQTFLRRAER